MRVRRPPSAIRHAFLTLCLSILAACGVDGPSPPATHPSQMELRLHEEMRHYLVAPPTPDDWNEEIRFVGPFGIERGQVVGGVAIEWEVRYSITEQRDADRCGVAGGIVWVDVKSYYPRHGGEDDLSPEELKRWRRFLDALRHLHRNHVAESLGAGRDVMHMLEGLEARTCVDLQSRAKRRTDAIVAQRREKIRQHEIGVYEYFGVEPPIDGKPPEPWKPPTDGKARTKGKARTDGKARRDGKVPTVGKAPTDGKAPEP